MSAARRYLRALGTALLRPREFFADDDFATDAAAVLGTVVLVGAAVSIGILLLGSIMAATVDASVLIDNPDRPPEWVCENHGDDPDSIRYEACQEPELVERNVGELLGSAAGDRAHWGAIGAVIAWLLLSFGLHLGARVAGGTGSIGDTLAIVAWSLSLELLRTAAGLTALWWAFATRTFGDGIGNVESELLAAIESVEPLLLGVTVAITAWQWHVWRCGLETRHDLPKGVAAGIAGVVASIAIAFAAI